MQLRYICKDATRNSRREMNQGIGSMDLEIPCRRSADGVILRVSGRPSPVARLLEVKAEDLGNR